VRLVLRCYAPHPAIRSPFAPSGAARWVGAARRRRKRPPFHGLGRSGTVGPRPSRDLSPCNRIASRCRSGLLLPGVQSGRRQWVRSPAPLLGKPRHLRSHSLGHGYFLGLRSTAPVSLGSPHPGHNQPLLWTGPRRVGMLSYSLACPARRVAGHRASSVMQQEDPSADPPSENVWRFLGTPARWFAGLVSLCALTPLFLLLFTKDEAPAWEQWTAVAVFTPMAIIGEWIVVTGRTTFRRQSGGRPAA